MLVLVVSFGVRLSGPNDLYEKTQQKTIAYTADMVANGRYLLPRDPDGAGATKPPLYNWLGSLSVGGLGMTGELGHKLPAVGAGILTVLMTIGMTGWLFKGGAGGVKLTDEKWYAGKGGACGLGLLAGMMWLGNLSGFKWIYIARPDGVMIACMAGAWISSTVGMSDGVKKGKLWAVLFWLCFTGVVLSKGATAPIVLVYAVLAGRVIFGEWKRFNRLYWWIGLPVAVGLVACWAWPLHVKYPNHFYDVYWHKEIVHHTTGGEGGGKAAFGFLKGLYKSPSYFVSRFMPWGIFVVWGFVLLFKQEKLKGIWKHPLGPAVLWCLVQLVLFCFVGKVKGRYLAATYPAAAGIAAYCVAVVFSKYEMKKVMGVVAGVCLLTVGGIGFYDWETAGRAKFAATEDAPRGDNLAAGEHVAEFAREVKGIVGDDLVVFDVPGQSVIMALLGRHQGVNRPTAEMMGKAKWHIRVLDDGAGLVKESGHVTCVRNAEQKVFVRLGLYEVE